MQNTNEEKSIQDMIQKNVPQSVSSEVKEMSTEKETVNESSSSRIWQEIASSKTKQVREIIQIGEQRGYQNNHHSSQNPSQQQIEKQAALLQQTDLQRAQQGNPQKDTEIKQTENHPVNKANLSTRKQGLVQYQSAKQLFPNGQVDLNIVYAEKQNQRIFELKREQLFGTVLEQKNQYFKQVQLQAIQWLLGDKQKKQTQKPNNTHYTHNIIRTVDLLYKKYIITPFKHSQQQSQINQYNIYKPDPIYCQQFYTIIDNSTFQNNHHYGISGDNFKRNAPGNNHYNQKYVSLVDNQSTNQNQDYLETIASNYVNGIRRNKFTDSSNSTTTQMQKSTISQGLDKFKKYGNPNSGISLPFDVELNSVSSKKQFNQQYSLFQSTDDDKSDRFNQQRNVAKTFVKDGYGLQIVRNHLGPSMDGGTYNRAITTIIRDSYKKIEDFLTKSCNMKIHSLTSSEFSLVKTPLVHCRNILRPEDLNTFFKYIGITYKFGKLKSEEYPTPQETLSLYNAILRGLNDRKNARDQTHRPNRQNRDSYYQ